MKLPDKILYLPIEVQARELDSKLIIAGKAIQKGFRVVLGNHTDDATEFINPGVVLYKDHGIQSEKRFRQWKERGWKVAALDEEGLIFSSDNIYKRTRISLHCIEMADKIFVWGQQQSNLFPKSVNKKLKLAGHPRFDIFRPVNNVLKKEWPPKKILINTRFPSINPIRTKGDEDRNLINLKVLNPGDTSREKFLVNEKRIFDEFCHFIRLIANQSNIEIILRIHPVESPHVYNSLIKEYRNVRLSRGSLLDDLRNCNVVIHDGCTTAIEAAHMGISVIALRPKLIGKAYNPFANQFGICCESAEELVKILLSGSPCQLEPEISNDTAREYIANWRQGVASDTIVEELYGVFSEGRDDEFFAGSLIFQKPTRISSVKVKSLIKDLFICLGGSYFEKTTSEHWLVRACRSQMLAKKKCNLKLNFLKERLGVVCDIAGIDVALSIEQISSENFILSARC